MKNAVTNQIKVLKKVKPNPDWLKSQRRNLLLQISSDNKAKKVYSLSGFSLFKSMPKLILKPVIAVCLLFAMIFGGGFLTIKIAEGSVPGDFLYPVKLVIEDVKIAFSSQEGKSKLQAQFVGQRVKELTQIINTEEALFSKVEKVNEAVDKLEDQVIFSKTELKKAKRNEPEKAKKIAETVKQETFNSEEELRKTKKKLVEKYKEEGSEETAQAIEIIDRALAVLLGEEKPEEKVTEITELEKEEKDLEEVGDIITSPTTIIPQNASESFNEPSEDFESINENENK